MFFKKGNDHKIVGNIKNKKESSIWTLPYVDFVIFYAGFEPAPNC